ncbi:MED7 protein-domain-containing protein [Cantharellus anzutake]|uniref:MED7 protein-domain-containing protein n=1 Tax=Cantharellus anzutake TaxID=1750568 RepID=UPI001903C049|nr:MED7 protein-domain-containing protein [Cantharellus anzutake]KAF8341294.1 MED7 protein-domain-containing protein [Cantharellus anzutake]
MSEEIVNPFPSPSSYYKLYTEHNLNLLHLLRTRTSTSVHDPIPPEAQQHQSLFDQSQVPPWDLTTLERPRADWIVEEGNYETFGDFWPIPERHPTLEEGGIQQLYKAGNDHREDLHKMLRTILVTYHRLVGALLIPPHPVAQEPEWVQHMEWIRIVTLNMVAAVNELRPVQARETLKTALRTQLESRRQQTKYIHAKCDELSEQLASLKSLTLQNVSTFMDEGDPSRALYSLSGLRQGGSDLPLLPLSELEKWANSL